MSQTMETLLAECAAEVLETMFFLPPSEDPADEPEGRVIEISVKFDGQPGGVFRLAIGAGAAMVAAGNFLGCDGPVTAEQARETVAEMANMVCGAVLSRVESETHFALAPPDTVAAAWPLGWSSKATRLAVEDAGTISMTLEFQP